MRREFAIVPPDLRLALPLPAIALLAALVGLGFAAREEPRVWFFAILIVMVAVFIVWSVQRRRVVLDGDLLAITAGLNIARVRVADLDLAAARSVNLADVTTLGPLLKTFGTTMPGYSAGHFRLRDRSRGFLLLTDRRKVLALPERGGRTLLLSLERPQGLLGALQAVANPGSRR